MVNDVTGETFLTTLGFNSGATTTNIIVLVCVYGAFALLAIALFLLRLPRTSHGRRRWAPAGGRGGREGGGAKGRGRAARWRLAEHRVQHHSCLSVWVAGCVMGLVAPQQAPSSPGRSRAKPAPAFCCAAGSGWPGRSSGWGRRGARLACPWHSPLPAA